MVATKPPTPSTPEVPAKAAKKSALSQNDVPSYSLIDSLRVPRVIADDLGKHPSTPLQVAAAMGVAPTTGAFRTMTAAAMAYGLTDAGAFAEKIALTGLGRRAVAPTNEGDDRSALLEAVMKPRVTREFLTRYDGSKWPRDDIARNVLEVMGVPAEQTSRALELIRKDARDLELLTNINGSDFVSLTSVHAATPQAQEVPIQESTSADASESAPLNLPPAHSELPFAATTPRIDNRRVFITHGKNDKIVGQIKKLLTFGDLEPVVAEESQSVAKPVPDKVMDEMRSCSAGIVHVGKETRLVDADGEEHQIINPNVLIEIGAAMALYRRKFILLDERGVTLPSNLQGLYEVRYEGGGLDHESTMALLEAFGGFKEPI
jgi:predicted nucleotide-binding protein